MLRIGNDTTRVEALSETTIRELIEAHPETMTVLAPLGIDLCCGGAHRLGVALDLRKIDRAPVLAQIANMIGEWPAVIA